MVKVPVTSLRKAPLYILDFAGIATAVYMILSETYAILGKWSWMDGLAFEEQIWSSLDDALLIGFTLLIASTLFFTFLLGWRQKAVCLGTILLGMMVMFALPLPKLGNIIFLSGVVGVLITYFIENKQTGNKKEKKRI